MNRRAVVLLVPLLLFLPARAALPSGDAALTRLVGVVAARLATADAVAAAKAVTGGPVDDPRREAVVLGAARRAAELAGVDPALAARVLRDQVEAGKDVQRGLLREPGRLTAGPVDLAAVRERIDVLTVRLVGALADAGPARGGGACPGLLDAARRAAERAAGWHTEDDALHGAALRRALGSVCAGRRGAGRVPAGGQPRIRRSPNRPHRRLAA
ncbi:chorismate mutase [Streptomyces avicenniae]|uniref:chorismate mutase n=1 Tax=Streptomyces avicenniae TaxID=500153 RepID=UPI00069AB48B|nr:chorismate mutase [Streptomyces avicenniae]